MRSIIFAAAVALLVWLGACGGSPSPRTPSQTTPSPPPVRTISGHPCTPTDEALQCVLPPAPRELRLRASPFQLRGIDAAWGAPSAAEARSRYGARFLAGYLSHDPSKDWTKARVAEYHRAGLGTVAVWETSAGRAGEGSPSVRCTNGHTDAFYAARKAAELGNTDRPIDFAIDFDAQGSQIDSYFRCVHAILGARANAYGSYYAVKYLCAHGLVGHTSWQTYAWSGGQWLPASCAPLEQYLNDGQVDFDRAIAADYGQWPGPEVAKPASHHDLEARIRTLHRVLASYGCNRRVRQHEPTGPTCKRWKREGDQRHHELGH